MQEKPELKSHRQFGDFSNHAIKKLKFYRDMTRSDKNLTEFIVNNKGHTFDEKLDPDAIDFSAPDFGFSDVLIYEDDIDMTLDDSINGWRKLMDCIALYPRY